MKLRILLSSLIVSMTGCGSAPTPKEPNGNWTPVQQVSASTSRLMATIRLKNKNMRSVSTNHRQGEFNNGYSISLEQAIEKYIPAIYRLEIDPDVDLKSEIALDNSKGWMDSLGQGLAQANMELVTNHYKKSATIKRTKLSLAEAIDLLLPSDYTVFTDTSVNQHILLHFDTRKNWVDALKSGTADAGIELTINFSKKTIYLTSVRRDVSQSIVVSK